MTGDVLMSSGDEVDPQEINNPSEEKQANER